MAYPKYVPSFDLFRDSAAPPFPELNPQTATVQRRLEHQIITDFYFHQELLPCI
jgi:hypothetical protein